MNCLIRYLGFRLIFHKSTRIILSYSASYRKMIFQFLFKQLHDIHTEEFFKWNTIGANND